MRFRISLLLVLLFTLSCVALRSPLASLPSLPQDLASSNGPNDVQTGSQASPRGNIYDRHLQELAVSFRTSAVYARPLEIADHEATAAKLAGPLGRTPQDLLKAIQSERGFVWLRKNLGYDQANAIKDLGIKGIYLHEEFKRAYPQQLSAAHIIGFTQNQQGLAGIEFQYDTILAGINQPARNLRLDGGSPQEPHLGTSIVLTLDMRIQKRLEDLLAVLAIQTGAENTAAVVMHTDSGEILALANQPTFDPNRFWDYSSEQRQNLVTSLPVHLGELSNLFSQAAQYEADFALAETEFPDPLERPVFLKPQQLKKRIHGPAVPFTISDPTVLADFTRQLGFLSPPAVDLPVDGDNGPMPALQLNDPGAAVTTPMHLLAAISTLLNGGRAVVPHLLDRVIENGDSAGGETAPLAETRQAIRQETSAAAREYLYQRWSDNSSAANGVITLVVDHPDAADTGADLEPAPAGMISRKDSPGAADASMPGQQLLLSLLSIDGHELAILVVLDHIPPATGKHAGRQETPMLAMTKAVIADIGQWATEEDTPIEKGLPAIAAAPCSPEMTPAEEDDSNRNVTAPVGIRMPDVSGKSLRSGLRMLQQFNLQLTVVGSGTIISQEPAAGTIITGNEACILQLRSNIFATSGRMALL